MKILARYLAPALAIALTLAEGAGAPALSQPQAVSVVVNGQPMSFDQPPIQRAGRVFVPLRGVFERLGASVVYQNGIINANGNGREISLQIGSTQATINGQPQLLDIAPFMVGARTLVPLRFVAQALGATVDWNQASSTVTIVGGQPAYVPPPPTVSQPPASLQLINTRPLGTISTLYPAIHAEFGQPVQPESLRVAVDNTDVTSSVYTNARGFDVTAPMPLPAGAHHVRVAAVAQNGYPVRAEWGFYTLPAQIENFINDFQPANYVFTTRPFMLRGRTLPYARVHAIATQRSGSVLGLFFIDTNTYQTDAVANADGIFRVNVDAAFVTSDPVRLVLQSVAPGGASAEQRLTLSY